MIKDLLHTRRADTICTVLVLLLFAYFIALVLNEIPYTPFNFDSALQSLTAKSIAYDLGKPITPYSFEFFSTSTGQVLVLWGAAWFKLFGNGISQPAFATASLNLLLLGYFLLKIRHFLPSLHHLFFTAGLLLVFIIKDLQWWTFFVGDIASFLMFMIAASIAAGAKPFERNQIICFVIFLVLALRTRPLIVPAMAGCCLYLLGRAIPLLISQPRAYKALLTNVAVAIATATALASMYELLEYSFFLLSKNIHYTDFLHTRRFLYSINSTAGLGSIINSPDPLQSIAMNARSNYQFLANALQKNLGVSFPLLTIATITAVTSYGALHGKNEISRWLIVILLAAAMTSIWFFFITRIIFDRYTLQIELLFAIMALAASVRLAGGYGVAILLGILLLFTTDDLRQKLHTTLLFEVRNDSSTKAAETYNQNIQETANFIQSHPPTSTLAKCGWMTAAWSVEYVLPGTNNMQDCYLLIREALKQDGDTNHYSWQKPVSFTWVMDKTTWKFSKINAIAKREKWKLFEACRTNTLYENENFKIMDCQFESLKAAIPMDSPSFFVDDTHYFFR